MTKTALFGWDQVLNVIPRLKKTAQRQALSATEKSPLSDLAGMFFVSAALLALEICLTRIFSTMIFYHFSFLAIGIVMLGFAFAGIVLVLLPGLSKNNAAVASAGLGFAVTSVLGIFILLFQPFFLKTLSIFFPGFVPWIVFALIIVAVFSTAFTFAGLTVSILIAYRPRDISRLYCANLTGAGTGAALILPLLSKTGALDAMLIIILIALLGGFCLSFSRIGYLQWRRTACALAAFTVLITMGVTERDTPFAESLMLRSDVARENRLFRKWNSFSCVDVYAVESKNPQYREPLWGLSRSYRGDIPELIKVFIDSWAMTAVLKTDKRTADLPFYDYLPANLAYALLHRPSVLVLGAGGGIDILSANHYNASAITGVEINPSIVALMKNELAVFSGGLYNQPQAPVHIAEGRHWLSRDTNTYDLIHLSGVDSLSGALSGAYCFSESYLYTVEAFSTYLEHLTENGMVTFLRFAFTPPMEMLRLFTTAVETLERRGVNSPASHLMVVHANSGLFAVMLMKKKPFTPEQMRTVRNVCKDNGFSILYSPDRYRENTFSAFAETADRNRFYRDYPLKITPVTDDSPFFFYYSKHLAAFKPPDSSFLLYFIGPMVLLGGMLFVLSLLPIFIIWPPIRYRKQKRSIGNPFLLILYFMGIGIAFMLVENLFIQKFTLFLGQPVYALVLVLFCMLIFAGLGSYWSGRRQTPKTHKNIVQWALPIVLAATFFGSDIMFPVMLQAGLSIRLLAAAILLAPCCFLMGIPFPFKIRAIERQAPWVIPWAWALNSYASVMGAFFSVLCGITLGFAVTCVLAAIVYFFCGFSSGAQQNFPAAADPG